jgi:hypothetical protein
MASSLPASRGAIPGALTPRVAATGGGLSTPELGAGGGPDYFQQITYL